MEPPEVSTQWLELAKVAIALLVAVTGLVTAYIVYRLGLRAYFRQKEFENVRKRHLDGGVELVCSQVDYALGVHRHNWMLLFRTMKQYRDIEEHISVEDFFDQFIEIDQSYFQITPMHKVQVLLKDQVVWEAYQQVFSFVGTTNDKIKADFGAVLKAMLEKPNHPNKEAFLAEAHRFAVEVNKESEKFSVLLAALQDIAEVLERENLDQKAIAAFASREEAQNAVRRLRDVFPAEDDAQQLAAADAATPRG